MNARKEENPPENGISKPETWNNEIHHIMYKTFEPELKANDLYITV